MRVFAASIEDVMREAAARWTLIAYFLLSSLFTIIFASAINLDIVDGTLAGAKLFGHNAQIRSNHDLDIEKLVIGFESTFSTVRLRHRKTRGSGIRQACLTMVFKLMESASKSWRLLNGASLLKEVIAGVAFEDGVKKTYAA